MIRIKPSLNTLGLFLLVIAAITTLNYNQNFTLIFFHQQPLFFFDWEALLKSFEIPGGFINYFASLATELYAITLLKIALPTTIFGSIVFYIYLTLKKNTGVFIASALSITTLLALLVLITDYSFKIESLLVISSSLFFTWLYYFCLKQIKKPLLLFVTIFILSYFNFLINSGIGLIFSALLISIKTLTSINKPQKQLLTVFYIIIIGLLIPIVSINFKFQTTSIFDAYLANFIKNKYYESPGLYFILLAAITISELIGVLFKKPVKLNKYVTYISIALLTSIVLILPSLQINTKKKTEINFDYLASTKNWQGISKAIGNNDMKVRLNAFQYNRALYNSNTLLENLCSKPQYFGNESLLVEREINSQILNYASDIYYDLGFINEARHWAHEAFTIYGPQPRILKRLVQVNIINGKYNTAKKYITLLKKSILHKKWAIEQEKYLLNEELIRNNSEYRQKRDFSPKHDFFTHRTTPWENLAELLKSNGSNKMAFEYLIANYLLRHELIHVIKLVPEFRRHGYPELPKAVQECILLYMVKTQKQGMQLAGYQFNKHITNQLKEYSQLYMKYKNNDNSAKQMLDKNFADTYWYYIHFISPITKQGKN